MYATRPWDPILLRCSVLPRGPNCNSGKWECPLKIGAKLVMDYHVYHYFCDFYSIYNNLKKKKKKSGEKKCLPGPSNID